MHYDGWETYGGQVIVQRPIFSSHYAVSHLPDFPYIFLVSHCQTLYQTLCSKESLVWGTSLAQPDPLPNDKGLGTLH